MGERYESLANPLRLIKMLSGDPEWSPHQKTVAFAIVFILFTAVAVWYVIQLYRCVKDASPLSKEIRHSQIFPHLRPVTFKGHKQVDMKSFDVSSALALLFCVAGSRVYCSGQFSCC